MHFSPTKKTPIGNMELCCHILSRVVRQLAVSMLGVQEFPMIEQNLIDGPSSEGTLATQNIRNTHTCYLIRSVFLSYDVELHE